MTIPATKRHAAWLLAALLLALPVFALAATGTVDVAPMRVYATPSLQAPVMAEFGEGARVQVLSSDGGWARIRLDNGDIGYSVAAHLKMSSKPASSSSSGSSGTVTRPNTSSDANATIRTQNRGPLHMRKEPGFDATIVKTYSNGMRVQVLSRQGEWFEVKVGSTVGFMNTAYVQLDSGVLLPGETQTGYAGVVQSADGSPRPLYQSPETVSEVLGSYNPGTYVDVLAVGAEWHLVNINGQRGYIAADAVSLSEPDSASPIRVAAGPIPLYPNASNTSEPLLTIPTGSLVTVLVPGSTFSRVRYTGEDTAIIGYAPNDSLQSTEPVVTELTFTAPRR